MAYNLTAFTDYIGRETQTLTKTLFAGGDTAKFAMFMAGVKGSTSIPHLSGGATLQAGTCVNPSGDTVAGEKIISVTAFTVYESFCQDDLQTKFPNTVLAPGSRNNDAPRPWEEALIDTKMSSINEQLEELYWQGDTDGVSNNLFDGFLKKLSASGDVVDGNPDEVTAVSKSNIRAVVDKVRDQAPAKVRRHADFTIMLGDDYFDMYIQAEKDANLYHYMPEHDEGVYRIGGSGARLVRTYGLNNTGRIVASVGSNFVVGSDVENEHEIADMFYDQTSDKTYLRVKAKAGVQLINEDEIVDFVLFVEESPESPESP